MATFCDICGADEYVCQVCGEIFCADCYPPVWRPDITGNKRAGNVCPTCKKKADES